MNYLTLITQFWRLRRSKRITSKQADLYFFLIQECNERDWENPFECSNGSIIARIDMQEPTLIDARNRLKQLGLIDFEGGRRNEASPVYRITYLNNLSKDRVERGVNSEEKAGESDEHYNNKQNETKPKQNKTSADAPDFDKKLLLENPFSEKFIEESWIIWKNYKRREFKFLFKSIESEQAALNGLVKVSEGSEQAAREIIQQSMENGWKGFFPIKDKANGQSNSKNGRPGPGTAQKHSEVNQAFNEFYSKRG